MTETILNLIMQVEWKTLFFMSRRDEYVLGERSLMSEEEAVWIVVL